MANFDPLTESKPLNRLTKKFGTGDYVGETTPYAKFGAKFGANPSVGGFCANG